MSTIVKKSIVVILVLIFCVSFLPNVDAVESPKLSLKEATYSAVCEKKVGNSANDFKYVRSDLLDEGKFAGPQDFALSDDGTIYILDTHNKRIITFFRSSHISLADSFLDLSFCKFPSRIWLFYGYLYVLDESENVLYKIKTHSNNIKKIPLPEGLEGIFIEELFTVNRTIILMEESFGETKNYFIAGDEIIKSDKINCAVSLDKLKANIQLGNSKWSVELSDSFIEIAGIDKDGNLYLVVKEYVPNTCVFLSELSIRKYDLNGNLLGCALIDQSEWSAFPRRCVKVDSNGDIFILVCDFGRVAVQKVTLGNYYISKMSELVNEAKTIEAKLNSNVTKETINVSYSRAQVRKRTNDMAYLSWTLYRENKIPPSGAALPQYILETPTTQTGTQMSGIPYCWGGMNGLETLGSQEYKQKFHTQIVKAYGSAKYSAGNISGDGSYKSGTAGLDCSGFVAAAYNMITNDKKNANWFLNTGGTTVILSNIKSMDFLAKSNHIMLFISKSTSGNYTVVDATTTNSSGSRIDKVSVRTETSSYVNGFIAKTPKSNWT